MFSFNYRLGVELFTKWLATDYYTCMPGLHTIPEYISLKGYEFTILRKRIGIQGQKVYKQVRDEQCIETS